VINTVVWFAAGAVAGALVTSRRRRAGSGGAQPGADAALLPDPALAWLAGARGAIGVWVSHQVTDHDAPLRWSRVTPGDRLSAAAVGDIEQRLAVCHREVSSGGTRLDAGTLLHASAGGLTAAVLLPPMRRCRCCRRQCRSRGASRRARAEAVLGRAVEEGGALESLGASGSGWHTSSSVRSGSHRDRGGGFRSCFLSQPAAGAGFSSEPGSPMAKVARRAASPITDPWADRPRPPGAYRSAIVLPIKAE
jgi:hypothetical protein